MRKTDEAKWRKFRSRGGPFWTEMVDWFTASNSGFGTYASDGTRLLGFRCVIDPRTRRKASS